MVSSCSNHEVVVEFFKVGGADHSESGVGPLGVFSRRGAPPDPHAGTFYAHEFLLLLQKPDMYEKFAKVRESNSGLARGVSLGIPAD